MNVQFINSLPSSDGPSQTPTHSHEAGHTHEHGGDHGHTHEHYNDAGKYSERDMPDYAIRNFDERGYTIGIGGYVLGDSIVIDMLMIVRPVGSGKTALTLALCQRLRKEYNIGTFVCFQRVLNPKRAAFSYCHERYFHPRRSRVSNQTSCSSRFQNSCYRDGGLPPCCYSRGYQCKYGCPRNSASQLWVPDAFCGEWGR